MDGVTWSISLGDIVTVLFVGALLFGGGVVIGWALTLAHIHSFDEEEEEERGW